MKDTPFIRAKGRLDRAVCRPGGASKEQSFLGMLLPLTQLFH